jgi:hypothetical protein
LSTRAIAAAVISATAAMIAQPGIVSARPRPRFEPTDLEWEETGVAEVDLEFGAIRSPGPWRFVIPDFELDFGIHHNVELDLDGAYAIEGPDSGSFSFDHAVPDSLWPSVKVGIWDDHDYEARRARAIGIQLGPKIPIAHGAHGIGAEGLLVFGGHIYPLNVVLNLGGFVEPAQDATSGRQVGGEAGLDLELQLDSHDRFQWTGELATAYFISHDPNQLHATTGITWSATPNLDLSVVGVFGFLAGDDRYGILFGIEPKLRMFEVPPRDVSRGEPASLARRVPSVGGFGNPLRVPEMKDGQ